MEVKIRYYKKNAFLLSKNVFGSWHRKISKTFSFASNCSLLEPCHIGLQSPSDSFERKLFSRVTSLHYYTHTSLVKSHVTAIFMAQKITLRDWRVSVTWEAVTTKFNLTNLFIASKQSDWKTKFRRWGMILSLCCNIVVSAERFGLNLALTAWRWQCVLTRFVSLSPVEMGNWA